MQSSEPSGTSQSKTIAQRNGGSQQSRPKKRKRQALTPETQPLYTPWIDSLGMREYESKEQRLHDEIVAFVSYIMPTAQERATRQRVFSLISQVVKKRFVHAEVSLFGSIAQDLCLPDGDVDLVVRLANIEHPSEKKKSLFQLSSILKRSGITHDVQVNHFAKVPLLAFQTTPDHGSLHIDLSINHDDGVAAIALITDYLAKMPALRPLVLIIKLFLSRRKLNDAASSGLNSYSIICMSISFLQLNPGNRPTEYIENPMESKSLGYLLMDFLLYYGSIFPYATSYISVTESKLLPKESTEWINKSQPSRLAAQCLVNPENDVAKSAGKTEAIKAAFLEAHASLTNYSFSLQTDNVLGAIIGLVQKTIDRREHIRNLVDSGRLATQTDSVSTRHSHEQPWKRDRHRQGPRNHDSSRGPIPPDRTAGPNRSPNTKRQRTGR